MSENIDYKKRDSLIQQSKSEILIFESAGRKKLQISTCTINTIHITHEREYRFNKISSNTFLTIFGPIKVKRAIYYSINPDNPDELRNENSPRSYVPLDQSWGMTGRTVTPEVTEAVLFASTSMENREISQLFGKIAHFDLSTSAIYQLRLEHGKAIHDWTQSEQGHQARLQGLQAPEQTGALVVGLDGVNLALREPAPPRGRPRQRPSLKNSAAVDPAAGERPRNSCYKNAMVGSFSFYGTSDNIVDINTGESRNDPHRLASMYTAQMPEQRFGAFKREFEMTLERLEAEVPEQAVKMLLFGRRQATVGIYPRERGPIRRLRKTTRLLSCQRTSIPCL